MTPGPSAPRFTVDAQQLVIDRALAHVREEQNLPHAVSWGMVAAAACAVCWALLTVVTGMQFRYTPIIVGFVVGTTVRLQGRGLTMTFGLVGAGLSVLACVTGDVLSAI